MFRPCGHCCLVPRSLRCVSDNCFQQGFSMLTSDLFDDAGEHVERCKPRLQMGKGVLNVRLGQKETVLVECLHWISRGLFKRSVKDSRYSAREISWDDKHMRPVRDSRCFGRDPSAPRWGGGRLLSIELARLNFYAAARCELQVHDSHRITTRLLTLKSS